MVCAGENIFSSPGLLLLLIFGNAYIVYNYLTALARVAHYQNKIVALFAYRQVYVTRKRARFLLAAVKHKGIGSAVIVAVNIRK